MLSKFHKQRHVIGRSLTQVIISELRVMKLASVLMVTPAVGLAVCPSCEGLNSKFAIIALRCPCKTSRRVTGGKTYATTAFISLIAIVFPMQPCGPVMKLWKLNVGLYVVGSLSQRSGLNSVASGPQTGVYVLIARILDAQ